MGGWIVRASFRQSGEWAGVWVGGWIVKASVR